MCVCVCVCVCVCMCVRECVCAQELHSLSFIQTGIGNSLSLTAQKKMMFSIKDFFRKFDQTRSFMRIWSHLPRKSLMENYVFCRVFDIIVCEGLHNDLTQILIKPILILSGPCDLFRSKFGVTFKYHSEKR